MSLIAGILILTGSSHATAEPRVAPADLRFQVSSGSTDHRFLRSPAGAVHLAVKSDRTPRIIAGFPAGNMGAGIWFEEASGECKFGIRGTPQLVTHGNKHGVSAVIESSCPQVINTIALGSLRFHRRYIAGDGFPSEMEHQVSLRGEELRVNRTSFDGQHKYETNLEALGGTQVVGPDSRGRVQINPAPSAGTVSFKLTALTNEQPLTPVQNVLTEEARATAPENTVQALRFLCYEEKLLAGSWRYLTYFGRDTLLTVHLLLPHLRTKVVEAALGSVLYRLSSDGQAAHEEDLGDFAAYRRLGEDAHGQDPGAPLYDYKMVDDNFLLAPLMTRYLSRLTKSEAEGFLRRKDAHGRPYRRLLLQNLRYVLREAEKYAEQPVSTNLVGLRPGKQTGDWRDSPDGLGGGTYSFSVNASFVPAALEAARVLFESGLVTEGESARDVESNAAKARRYAKIWDRAAEHFRIPLSGSTRNARAQSYARSLELNFPQEQKQTTSPGDFYALALEKEGNPIQVAHSDVGFRLLFNEPSPAELDVVLQLLKNPFPLGLFSDVGLLIANPAFATDKDMRSLFTADRYHGTVVWSWQQALMQRGLRRQIQREDLTPDMQGRLRSAHARMQKLIQKTAGFHVEELWTFEVDRGEMKPTPFGSQSDHQTESNPIQLWSTVSGLSPALHGLD